MSSDETSDEWNEICYSESETDDSSSQSNDNHVPSAEEVEEVETRTVIGPHRKRKKFRKREQRKILRAKGEAYCTEKGKQKLPRSTGPKCQCKYRCFQNFDAGMCSMILSKFNAIGEKSAQDKYLIGLISVATTKRKLKPEDNPIYQRAFSNTYKVRLGTVEHRICKRAFCSIHGISPKRVEILAKKMALDTEITSPPETRGKHDTRPNKVPNDAVANVHAQISSIPRRSSHYSRRDNIKKYYLSPELNISKLYLLYLEKYEPNARKPWERKRKHVDKPLPVVSQDFYSRYFNTNFKNYAFGSPRSDSCATCDKFDTQIQNKSDTVHKAALILEKEEHVKIADVFFSDLTAKRKLALTEEDIDVICFDFQQNLPLPKLTVGDVFYATQLWVYNFCITSIKNKKSYFFVYNEMIAKKSPNEVISFVDYFLKNILSKKVKTLYVYSDNAAAQNKNKVLIQFWNAVIETNRLSSVFHIFPLPGHSFLPCDASFGTIEKCLRRCEKIYTQEEYEIKIRGASNESFEVIHVEQNMILDYRSHFASIFKNFPTTLKIQKLRVFRYLDAGSFSVSPSIQNPIYSTIILNYFMENKKKVDVTFPPDTETLYSDFLPVKPAKYKSVKNLVEKYVPAAYASFYENMRSTTPASTTSAAHDDESDVTDDVEDPDS